MRQDEIKYKLKKWAERITSKYEGLRVRYEFCAKRGVFLVSYDYDHIENMDEFFLASMDFEEKMDREYGDGTPLFCDNEELFSLSAEAETIFRQHETAEWCFQLDNSFTTPGYNWAA